MEYPKNLKARWTAALLLFTSQLVCGYTLDAGSHESIKTVASSIVDDMMLFYNGDQPGGTPGLLPQPYYWWEAGALMGVLVDYWYYTGDSRYNDIAEQGLLFQVGPHNDYMPPNQTMTEGNDDQGFWGMAAMSAAEYNFQNPAEDQPQWLALAQAVFNTQVPRWDMEYCNGGLRWQIFTWNAGFNYKNTISQACFFNIAARLALYTGNVSYADWADKTWEWMVGTKLMDVSNYYVYDGGHVETNCTNITPYQWTYNAGAFLHGAAAMYNHTTGATREKWRERVDGLLNGTSIFFTGDQKNIMTEVACEPVNLCDVDQQSFKAYLSRWLAATTKWAPWTFPHIKPLLAASAVAAAAQCTGGSNGRMCGLRWTDAGEWDGSTGVGQQMAALEIVLSNMIEQVSAPVTTDTGGTSIGDPSAGGSDIGKSDPGAVYLESLPEIEAADRAGAYILTVILLISLAGGMGFVLHDEASSKTTPQQLDDIKDFIRSWPAAVAAAFQSDRSDGESRKGKGVDRSGTSTPASSAGMENAIRLTTQSRSASSCGNTPAVAYAGPSGQASTPTQERRPSRVETETAGGKATGSSKRVSYRLPA